MASQSARAEAARALYFAEGAPDRVIDDRRAEELVDALVQSLGPVRRVLLLPPDFTRLHSGAGELTRLLYQKLSPRAEVLVLPALGTHSPMTPGQIDEMYPGVPHASFRVHDWRHGTTTLGEVPASFVREVSAGLVDYPIRCELSNEIARGGWDRIISIGQVVPHEVAGLAGHAKNVFIGAGGKDVIDRTHFLGAACGFEAAMGRADTPVRRVLDYIAREIAPDLPITYLLTVRERLRSGAMATRGLYAGDDDACFHAAVPLAQRCNIVELDETPEKVVVYLDPREYRSTWLGNKAIYRSRLAVADGAELVILAPGVRTFGEDPGVDRLIRRHGYRGTPNTLAALESDPELRQSLCAAAHLIHGSSEGRFRIRYASAGLDPALLESVGYESVSIETCWERYDPSTLAEGFNDLPNGERIFYIANPALGLWTKRSLLQ
jgi:nickel-dependent lactate racemase